LFSSVTCEFHFANDLKSSIVWVTGTSFTFVNLIFGFGMASINAGSYKTTLVAEFDYYF
jgi:multisubunit Na+/H+ antiporter MnhE subunit